MIGDTQVAQILVKEKLWRHGQHSYFMKMLSEVKGHAAALLPLNFPRFVFCKRIFYRFWLLLTQYQQAREKEQKKLNQTQGCKPKRHLVYEAEPWRHSHDPRVWLSISPSWKKNLSKSRKVMVMLHGTIRSDDFWRNTALQCWNNAVTSRKNVPTMLQRCVALKVVVAPSRVTYLKIQFYLSLRTTYTPFARSHPQRSCYGEKVACYWLSITWLILKL